MCYENVCSESDRRIRSEKKGKENKRQTELKRHRLQHGKIRGRFFGQRISLSHGDA